MFFKLMNREIKSQFKSITFYMFLIVIVLYYTTQYVPPTKYDPLKPIPSNLKENGTSSILIDELNEMTFVYYRMNYNLENNVVAKYNLGFKKWHKIDTNQKKFLQQMRDKIYGNKLDVNGTPEFLVSYDNFLKIIDEVDKVLGGNTVYGNKYRDEIYSDIFYGHKTIDDPNIKIRAGYEEMSIMVTMNEYLKRSPIINLSKKLSDDQRNALEKAMKEISPQGLDEDRKLINPVNYEEYEKILDQLDKEFKDTTIFSKENRHYIHMQNKTYDDAVKDFNENLHKDRITNAYGRLFSDYLGITAGFFPAFIAVAAMLRDRRKNINGLIKNKSFSTIVYMFSKYCGICISLLIGYMLLATHSTYVFYKISKTYNYLIDFWAFYKYTLTWIAPTIFFTVAISMLLYTIFNKISLPIIFQFILWAFSTQTLSGNYSLYRFIIRFNILGDYKNYILWKPDIIINRIFYTLLSLGIIIIATYIHKSRVEKTDNNKL